MGILPDVVFIHTGLFIVTYVTYIYTYVSAHSLPIAALFFEMYIVKYSDLKYVP